MTLAALLAGAYPSGYPAVIFKGGPDGAVNMSDAVYGPAFTLYLKGAGMGAAANEGLSAGAIAGEDRAEEGTVLNCKGLQSLHGKHALSKPMLGSQG